MTLVLDAGGLGALAGQRAIVIAFAGTRPDPIVLTSDPGDLGALAGHSVGQLTIAAV